MGGAPFIGYSGGGGRRGGGFNIGGLILPLILVGGIGTGIWYFGFGPGKNQILGTGHAIGQGGATVGHGVSSGATGIAKWGQDYGLYITGAGVVFSLLFRLFPRYGGVAGALMTLIPWGMIIGGGLLFFSNFAGKAPNIGAAIRNITGSHFAAVPNESSLPMGGKLYSPVQRRIITGTQQNTQTNPSYDSNSVFPVIGDVY